MPRFTGPHGGNNGKTKVWKSSLTIRNGKDTKHDSLTQKKKKKIIN